MPWTRNPDCFKLILTTLHTANITRCHSVEHRIAAEFGTYHYNNWAISGILPFGSAHARKVCSRKAQPTWYTGLKTQPWELSSSCCGAGRCLACTRRRRKAVEVRVHRRPCRVHTDSSRPDRMASMTWVQSSYSRWLTQLVLLCVGSGN